jgi:hypothetical protein
MSLEVPGGHLVVRVRPGFKQWRCGYTGACNVDNNTNPVGGYINFATLSGHYVSPLVYAATTLIARAFDAGSPRIKSCQPSSPDCAQGRDGAVGEGQEEETEVETGRRGY